MGGKRGQRRREGREEKAGVEKGKEGRSRGRKQGECLAGLAPEPNHHHFHACSCACLTKIILAWLAGWNTVRRVLGRHLGIHPNLPISSVQFCPDCRWPQGLREDLEYTG